MSYPNVIYGDFGDEKVAQSTAIGSLPLGQLMILPDGRKFRHGQAAAASLLAGQIVSTSAAVSKHGDASGSGLLASATVTNNAIGNTAVILLTNSAAITKDQYAGGYLHVMGPAASTYIGHVYRIKSNLSCAVSAKATITLEPTDPLKVAFKAGTTICGLRRSSYKDLIVNDGATVIAPVMGAVPVAVSTSFYFWTQRSGEASLLQAETVLVNGTAIIASSVEAGSVTVALSASAALTISINRHLGQALMTAAASQAVLCYLTLE